MPPTPPDTYPVALRDELDTLYDTLLAAVPGFQPGSKPARPLRNAPHQA